MKARPIVAGRANGSDDEGSAEQCKAAASVHHRKGHVAQTHSDRVDRNGGEGFCAERQPRDKESSEQHRDGRQCDQFEPFPVWEGRDSKTNLVANCGAGAMASPQINNVKNAARGLTVSNTRALTS